MLDGGPKMARGFNRTPARAIFCGKRGQEAHAAAHFVGRNPRQSESELVNEHSLRRHDAFEIFDIAKMVSHFEAPVVVRTNTVAEAGRASSAAGGGLSTRSFDSNEACPCGTCPRTGLPAGLRTSCDEFIRIDIDSNDVSTRLSVLHLDPQRSGIPLGECWRETISVDHDLTNAFVITRIIPSEPDRRASRLLRFNHSGHPSIFFMPSSLVEVGASASSMNLRLAA